MSIFNSPNILKKEIETYTKNFINKINDLSEKHFIDSEFPNDQYKKQLADNLNNFLNNMHVLSSHQYFHLISQVGNIDFDDNNIINNDNNIDNMDEFDSMDNISNFHELNESSFNSNTQTTLDSFLSSRNGVCDSSSDDEDNNMNFVNINNNQDSDDDDENNQDSDDDNDDENNQDSDDDNDDENNQDSDDDDENNQDSDNDNENNQDSDNDNDDENNQDSDDDDENNDNIKLVKLSDIYAENCDDNINCTQCCARIGNLVYNIDEQESEFMDNYPSETYIDSNNKVYGNPCNKMINDNDYNAGNIFCEKHKKLNIYLNDIRKPPLKIDNNKKKKKNSKKSNSKKKKSNESNSNKNNSNNGSKLNKMDLEEVHIDNTVYYHDINTGTIYDKKTFENLSQ